MKLSSQAVSDTGRVRPHNEDRCFASDEHGLYAVADGLGGLRAGEVASQIFAEVASAAAPGFREIAARAEAEGPSHRPELLKFVDELFQAAARAIYERAERDPETRGMATTGVVLGLLDGLAVIGHVGDSRAYLVRKGEARQLTTDHTVYQRLVDAGLLSDEQTGAFPYRNLLERSVGDLPHCQVDTCILDVQPGDRFLLMSDGLSGYFEPPRLAELCAGDLAAAIDAANRLGGADNITVVAVQVGDAVRRLEVLDTDTRVRALNQLPIFAGLTFPEILQTMKMVRERRCAAGERVVSEGDPGTSMFVVVDGALRVEKGAVTLATLAAGDHFGDIAFLDQGPRAASVIAETPAVLLVLERDDFQQLAGEHPAIASKLLNGFALSLARRLRALADDHVIGRES